MSQHRRRGSQRRETLGVKEVTLESHPLRDVANQGDIAHASLRRDLRHRELHRERLAVLAPAGHDADSPDGVRLPRALVALDVAVVLAGIGLVHQDVHLLALDLLGGVPEHPLGSRIEEIDSALGVDRNDRVLGGIHDGEQPGLASPSLTPRPGVDGLGAASAVVWFASKGRLAKLACARAW